MPSRCSGHTTPHVLQQSVGGKSQQRPLDAQAPRLHMFGTCSEVVAVGWTCYTYWMPPVHHNIHCRFMASINLFNHFRFLFFDCWEHLHLFNIWCIDPHDFVKAQEVLHVLVRIEEYIEQASHNHWHEKVWLKQIKDKYLSVHALCLPKLNLFPCHIYSSTRGVHCILCLRTTCVHDPF